MNTTTFDNQKYISPTWKEMGELCFELSKQILAKQRKFDRIIALAKSGLTWSRALADYLVIKDISAVHVSFYQGVYKTANKPVVIQPFSVSVKGETMLLFDDISDSGETLLLTCDYLKSCGVKQVETATLFHKPWSKFVPTYYAATTDAWIVAPHEVRETIVFFSQKWAKQLTKKEIADRLVKMGLPKDEVEYFMDNKHE